MPINVSMTILIPALWWHELCLTSRPIGHLRNYQVASVSANYMLVRVKYYLNLIYQEKLPILPTVLLQEVSVK